MKESNIKRVLQHMGITYRGIQRGISHDLVLFDNLYGSTVSVHLDSFTPEAVRNIQERRE